MGYGVGFIIGDIRNRIGIRRAVRATERCLMVSDARQRMNLEELGLESWISPHLGPRVKRRSSNIPVSSNASMCSSFSSSSFVEVVCDGFEGGRRHLRHDSKSS